MRISGGPLNGRPSMLQAVRMKLFSVSAAAFCFRGEPSICTTIKDRVNQRGISQHENVQEQIGWP